MKKVFFFDIDGTIVDNSRGLEDVSIKTKYAFNELSKDNYVLIASGRCKGLLDDKIKNLKTNGYVLCNGSYAEVNNEVIFSKTFSKEEVRTIKQIVKQLGGFTILETLDDVFTESKKHPLFIRFLQGWNKPDDEFKEDGQLEDGVHIMMVGFETEELVTKAQEELSKIAGVDRHYWYLSHDINIKNINKVVGCKKVIEYLNIDLKDSYAFGDGINDIQMLESVGHPVVMENAAPILKEKGYEQTDDVVNDGVYNYLVKNGLIKPLEEL